MSYTKTDWVNSIMTFNYNNSNKIENQIVLNTNDLDYYKKLLSLDFKIIGNKKFIKIVEQKLSKYRVYFDNDRSTLFQPSPYSYSLLGLIDNLTYQNGIYEFIYEDVTNNVTNQWSQTSNPIFTSTPTGYTPINIQSTVNWGAGLRKQSTSCYIDGCTGTSWYWCVCSFIDYKGGMPCGAGETLSQHMRLWLRIK